MKFLGVIKYVSRRAVAGTRPGQYGLGAQRLVPQHYSESSLTSNGFRTAASSWNVSSSWSHHHRELHTSRLLEDCFKIQDEEDFKKKVLENSKPVVVQFHATWCGPCKMLAPRMEKSIVATNDAVDLAQVDIDDNPDIAMSYSVGAVPSVMALKDGKVVDKFVGLKDEDQIDSFVAKLVN